MFLDKRATITKISTNITTPLSIMKIITVSHHPKVFSL